MYNPGYQQPAYSVFRRRMSPQEAACLVKPAKALKGPLMMFSIMACVCALIIFVKPAYAAHLAMPAIATGFVSLFCSLAVRAMTSKAAKMIKAGEVTVVQGTASWTGAQWTVGPITLRDSRGLRAVLREGPTEVAIVLGVPPATVSVNGTGLKEPTWAQCSGNLGDTSQYQQQRPQSHQQSGGYQPQGVFCPSCNLKNPPGTQYCQSCQAQLLK